jgi:hypothetical protein
MPTLAEQLAALIDATRTPAIYRAMLAAAPKGGE